MPNIFQIFLFNFIFLCLIFCFKAQTFEAINYGAYKTVPNSDNLQYRLGNGLGYIGNGWDDARMSNLSRKVGYDTQRKKLPEDHFKNWGYGIELGDAKINTQLRILDVVGYLATPTKEHSSNVSSNSELCYPANLYMPIFLTNGSVNPENYWAYYVNQTVSIYKDHIKIWEIWNEPDYTQNHDQVGNWYTSPPNPNILTHWYGTIFQYIRLIRITYEVAKKADPNCFVTAGGLGYPEFLDAILRYTDNPEDGTITADYPYKGGAYFDCDAYHQYPKFGVKDLETEESYDDNGSDTLAKKVVILKKNHEYILKKYGFDGTHYPKKLFINTETGLRSEKTNNEIGGDLVRRNWILKLALFSIEYDVKQTHMLVLSDDGKGVGDFSNLGQFKSIEEGFTHLKSSSRGRLVLQMIHFGKFEYDKEKTKEFLVNLPEGTTGIVLKRKLPKEDEEEFYSEYIYSAWIFCEKEEVSGEIDYKLNSEFAHPLLFDWKGNQKNVENDSIIKLSSTPVFLIENNGDYPDVNVDNDNSNYFLKSKFYMILLLCFYSL